ncbi:proliferation marker protein Ki-67 [Danio aesculapii]|uniref:proliferation marker protein Ki-67 n=1 Tax=Danio aesculapii TaxID=1142201 RepID=UPI0024BF60EC|nr:proliferation marker protein Ki-67 [Danio aesculapii]
MPLLGKIVVIKRNGADGTEFPLTASCLFGRKMDCDIRIQLPQVSKEHCKIELNENKELILTNLSSVNPTRINGQVFNQSERLKHGDLITIIDRSFRFEYPPPKTPKKRLSGKDKTVQALQEQQEKSTPVEKRKSEHSFDTCLKDGSNLPPTVEQTSEAEPEDAKLKKESLSPFCELYQMVKQDLVAKSPWRSELPKTPLARSQRREESLTADARSTPKQLTTPSKKRRSSKSSSDDATKSTTPQSSFNANLEDVTSAGVKSTPKQITTPSAKKRRSSKSNFEDAIVPATPQSSANANLEEKSSDVQSVGSYTPSATEKSTTPVSQKRTPSTTPHKFSAGEVVKQILLEPQPDNTPKSPKGRQSGVSQDQNQPQTPGTNGKNSEVKMSPRTSPRSNAGKRFQAQDVLQENKAATSASKNKADTSINEQLHGIKSHTKVVVAKPKRKRVSFGGQLSPELFDKRLPPDSPLRRGATPRHSLGPSQKPQSLLRRASTIGLLGLRLDEITTEAQKASPKRSVKTPSPAKRTPSTKAKTPSPKQKSPSSVAKVYTPTPATPKTPASARRASTGDISLTETPRVQGRFSISRISTPSPVQDQEENAEVQSAVLDVPQKYATPEIPLKRKSMKSSGRKTPKSALKSALNVMRSRRSGASRANLKVLTSWADIVKFGQTKPQIEVATNKKPTKNNIVKRTVAPKPKTPLRRLKDDVSTGHAASPATIVVGKAHMRMNQFVGAAPKIVPNIALFKKDMKMDEDFTGVADIFKTPATSKSKKIVVQNNDECPEVLPDESSVMKTPEELGEMIVSPLSVFSTAKCGRYNNEAVTRLLLDNQDGSLMEDESQASGKENISDLEIPSSDQTEKEETTCEMRIETPKQKAAQSLCLTGVKRLMKTPKQRAEPLEDLRGKLLKTPKDCKPSQEESLEGIKELLKTPKYRGAPVEDMVGVKRVMQTPKQKSNPVLCATGLQRLLKTPQTPKEKTEQQEDLTGVKELMKTPKVKGKPVENQFGLKRLVKTPREKRNPVEEDLTGVQQLMKTPKHKGELVEDQMGIKQLMQSPIEKTDVMQSPKPKEPASSQSGISRMKTPKVKETLAEEDFTDLKELVEEQENNSTCTEVVVTLPNEVKETVAALDGDYAFIPAEAEAVESVTDPEIEANIPKEKHPAQANEKSASVEVIEDCSLKDDKNIGQSEEVCTSDTSSTVEANSTFSTAVQENEEPNKSSISNKIQHGRRGRVAQKNKNEMAKAPALLSLIEEHKMTDQQPSSPSKGRRGRRVLEVPEITASPVRKSARGRITKHNDEDQQEKNIEASQEPADCMKIEISECLPVVTKTRRGRKAKQDDADVSAGDQQCSDVPATDVPIQVPVVKPGKRKMDKTESKPSSDVVDAAIEPVYDINASVPQASDGSATEEVVQTPVVKPGRRRKMEKIESKPLSDAAAIEFIHDVSADVPQGPNGSTVEKVVQAPVMKTGRRQKVDKSDRQPSEELEEKTPEIVCEGNDVAPEVTETVPATRARRGRPFRKENLKTEPAQILDEVLSTPTVLVDEKPLTSAAKSGRGRKAKQESVKDQTLDDEMVDGQTVAEANDVKEPEAPVVKSGRGRKAKQQKANLVEEVDQPTVDTSIDLPVTEEQTKTVVKSVRGGRNTKQSKLAVSVEAEEKVVSLPEQAEAPVLKSVRKRNVIAKETEIDAEVPVKRSRRAVADPVLQVAVVPSRGRKAVVKSQPEVTEDVASPEETIKVVKGTRRRAKEPESKKEESPLIQASSEIVAVLPLDKVERVSRGKKQKDSTKDCPINTSAITEEANETKPSKTVNWNPDLVASKDIEEFESTADVIEPQLKKSRRLVKSPAKASPAESDQSTDLPLRGRRGRAAAKKEDLVEDSQEETQMNVKTTRKGKAVASTATKSEPSNGKASIPLKRKRNDVLDVTEDAVIKEPLPKRRGRVTKSTDVAEEVLSKEKIPEAEQEMTEANPKTANRSARGQKKTAQQTDPAPAQTQEPVSGSSTRKGRGVKKVEEVDVSTVAAPVRRTRRK